MYSDSVSGGNNNAKYFDKLNVVVPMFEAIGQIGKYCTLSFGDIL